MGRFGTVFLDRDGVVIARAHDDGYVSQADEVVVLPQAAAAIGRLNAAGVFVVLVTNQRGVARGLMKLEDVDTVNARLSALLSERYAWLDAVYVCPHEIGTCDCRKPAPGLLLRAADDHPRIDLAHAVTVGDTESDVEAGSAAGTATVRLASPRTTDTKADLVVADLAAAVEWILGPEARLTADE